MTKETAQKLLTIYEEAWTTQNPDLIVSIFTEDATYHDPHEPKNNGLEAIRSYWVTKVVNGQKDITFKLLNVWTDEGIVIAEWHAEFTDLIGNQRIKMDEVAIFTTTGEKFNSLREYYKTEKAPLA